MGFPTITKPLAGLRDPESEGRRCCLCGATSFRLVHQWPAEHPRNSATIPLGFWECECGLPILHPVPTEAELPDDGEWWTSNRKMLVRRRRFKQLRNKVAHALLGDPVQRLVRQTVKAQPRGRLLDIGCGMGQLLNEASRYYQCDGLEPSPVAANHLRELGFEVIEDFFEPAAIASDTYDVATMDAVLEHVTDPVDVLRKVNRILKPGGVVAVKVPKYLGMSHRLHGTEWNGYRLGYHLTMFNGEMLDRTMEAAGFEPLRNPRRDRAFDDILLTWGRKLKPMQERDYHAHSEAA